MNSGSEPPFAFARSGSLVGFEVDLHGAVVERTPRRLPGGSAWSAGRR